MAGSHKAEINDKQITRQENKKTKVLVQELSGKSYAGRSIMLMILRIVIVIILLVVAAVVGAMIGYGVIGDGNMLDALKPSTWTHVFDIMNGTEDKK